MSDEIAQLRVTGVKVTLLNAFSFSLTLWPQLDNNAFSAIPPGVLTMTQLTVLDVRHVTAKLFFFLSHVCCGS